MRYINFTKMVAAGNDFIVAEIKPTPIKNLKDLAKKICNRKQGVGADGLLVLEKSKVADVKMRIFNIDGSEAEMCANGARCIALWTKSKIKKSLPLTRRKKSKIRIETKVGIIESELNKDNVKIRLTDPRNIKLDIPLDVNNRRIRVNFIDSGVPHAVIFVEGIRGIDVKGIGEKIRYHKKFAPRGTNVDFVEVLGNNVIKIRTYERGVEDETLACGTGAVASAIITNYKLQITKHKSEIKVYTQGGEVLTAYFDNLDDKIKNVWLEGKARIVYGGKYYV